MTAKERGQAVWFVDCMCSGEMGTVCLKHKPIVQAILDAEAATKERCVTLARSFSDVEGYESSTAQAIAQTLEALE